MPYFDHLPLMACVCVRLLQVLAVSKVLANRKSLKSVADRVSVLKLVVQGVRSTAVSVERTKICIEVYLYLRKISRALTQSEVRDLRSWNKSIPRDVKRVA